MALGRDQAIRIPIEAEISNVGKTIEELRKALSNVKPDTKAYRQIEQLLDGAEKKMLQVRKAAEDGFISKTQLASFEKNFIEVFSNIKVAAKSLGEIGFDNLIVPDEVTDKLEDYRKEIENVKKEFLGIQADKIRELSEQSEQMAANLKNVGIDFKTDNIDSALEKTTKKITTIRGEIEKLQKEAQKADLGASQKKSQIAQLEDIKKIFSGDAKVRANYSQYFASNGNFKAGGSKSLAAVLESYGIVDTETLDKVKASTASKLEEIQKVIVDAANKRQSVLQKQANDEKEKVELNTSLIQIKEDDISNLENLHTALEGLEVNPSVIQAFQAMENEIKRLNQEITNLKQKAVESAGGMEVSKKAADDTRESVDNLNNKIRQASSEMDKVGNINNTISNIKRSIAQWMGFYQVINLTRRAVKNIINDIRELDKVMTEIAIVTNMTQSDLWSQMNTYQGIAKQYGVATKGVYEVSQLFYQQGLDSVNVMKLTTETLKMAKIAGLEYRDAADYMTAAIRGFHLEMSDAQNVVDVYSNIASKSASSTEELAIAMSKTASSAAAVGSSFENTTAMIALMVETTRESSQNIGSALKSIISRYGEMKANPAKLVDSEGEEMDFNKVDTALKSVGISIKNASGQFKNFDDVILELSKKWKTLDINTQRYIATIMAGNRQQSRFLALVSDYDRLIELTEEAANSEDAATLQTLKTMDSLETKIQNVKTAWQGFYANLGLESLFKGVLDTVTKILNRLNSMPKLFGKLPVLAVALVAKLISVIKLLGNQIITTLAKTWQRVSKDFEESLASGGKRGLDRVRSEGENLNLTHSQKNQQKIVRNKRIGVGIANAINIVGTGIETYAQTIGDERAKDRGITSIVGGTVSGLGAGFATGIQTGSVFLGILSGITSAAASVISGINDLDKAQSLYLKSLEETAQKKKEEALVAKSEVTNLESTIKKLKELEDARYDSNEAYQEWLNYKNQIVETYPELLTAYTLEGEAIVDLSKGYILLAQKREAAAKAALEEKKAVLNAKKEQSDYVENTLSKLGNFSGLTTINSWGDKSGSGLKNISLVYGEKNTVEYAGLQGRTYRPSSLDEEILFQYLLGGSTGKNIDFTASSSDIEMVLDSQYEELKEIYASLLYENFSQLGILDSSIFKEVTNQTRNSLESMAESFPAEKLAAEYLKYFKMFIESGKLSSEEQKEVAEAEKGIIELESSFTSIFTEMVKNNPAFESSLNDLASKASTNKIVEAMMSSNLPEGTDLETWRTEDTEGYKNQAKEYVNQLVTWYNVIGDEQYNSVISLLSHPEEYSSTEQMEEAVKEKLISLGLTEGEAVYEGLLKQISIGWESIVESARANFERNILKLDNEGNSLLQEGNDLYNEALHFIDLANNLPSKYLQQMNAQWTALVANNKNENNALKNAEFLNKLYNLDEIPEDLQGGIIEIINTIDFTSKDSIQQAIDAINTYAKNNNITNDVEQTVQNLEDYRDLLITNLNTELNSYKDLLKTSTENKQKVLKVQTSGFSDIEEMQKAFKAINRERELSGEAVLSWDEAFELDKATGKYIYSRDGLLSMLAAQDRERTKKLEEISTKLEQIQALQQILPSDTYEGLNWNDEQIIDDLNDLIEQGIYSELETNALQQIITIMEKGGKSFAEAYAEFVEGAEEAAQTIEDLNGASDDLIYAAEQISARSKVDFSSIVGGKNSQKIRKSIESWFDSLILTQEGQKQILDILEQSDVGISWKEDLSAGAEIKDLSSYFIEAIFSILSGDFSQVSEFLENLLGEDFDIEAYRSFYESRISHAYNILSQAIGKTPNEIIKLTQEQADYLNNLGLNIVTENEGILITTAGDLVNAAATLQSDINKELELGLITISQYIELWKTTNAEASKTNKLRTTLDTLQKLDSIKVGDTLQITEEELLTNLADAGLEFEKIKDAAGNLYGAYITGITGDLREIYTVVLNWMKNTGSEVTTLADENNAWAKANTDEFKAAQQNLINISSKLTKDQFQQYMTKLNLTMEEVEKLIGDYYSEDEFGNIIIKDLKGIFENLGIDTTKINSEAYKAIENFNKTQTDNYVNLINKNNEAAIRGIEAVSKSSLSVSDIASLAGSEDNLKKILDEQGNVIDKQWKKAIKKVGKNYKITNFDEYLIAIQEITGEAIEKTSEEYINAYKNYVNQKNNDYDFSGFEVFFQDYKEVTYSQLVKIAQDLGRSVDELEAAATKNSNGTYDVTKILMAERADKILDTPLEFIEAILSTTENSSNTIINYVKTQLPKEKDKASKYISEILHKIIKQTDTEIKKEFENLAKGPKKFSTLTELKDFQKTLYTSLEEGIDYNWDNQASAYVMTIEGYQKTIRDRATALYEYVRTTTGDIHKAEEEVFHQLQSFVTATASNVNISDYINSERTADDIQAIKNSYNNFVAALKEMGEEVSLSADKFVEILDAGGIYAIQAANIINQASGHRSLNLSTITAVYQAGINGLQTSLSQLEYGVGAVVSEEIGDILKQANYGVKAIGYQLDEEGNKTDKVLAYVITKQGKLSDAYKTLIEVYGKKVGATLSDLNNLTVKMIENYPESQAYSIASQLNNMTVNGLSQIMNAAGIELGKIWDYLINNNIISYDGDELKVLDADALFSIVGLNLSNYLNDPKFLSMVNEATINSFREKENKLAEQVENAVSAGANSKTDLSYLVTALDETALNVLATAIESNGGTLINGILTLNSNSNIAGINQVLLETAQKYGNLTAQQMAQIQDAALGYLEDYTNLLSNGIKGTLSTEDAVKLRQLGNQLNVELDFTRTEEGIKLSANSAIKLTAALKDSKDYSGKISLKQLREDLKEILPGTENYYSTLKKIKELEEQLGKEPDNGAVKERLALYREIAEIQFDDSSTYKFMDKDLPSGMQNYSDFLGSWNKLFTALNKAKETGRMELQDFYNMVNELNLMAEQSGTAIEFMGHTLDGKMESAAALIMKGARSLDDIDGEGLKVNLSKFAGNLITGADDMADGIEAGLKVFAQEQIKMLDAAIQMLEGIVALEQLGELDFNGNGIFDMKDMFEWDEDTDTAVNKYSDKFDAAREKIYNGLKELEGIDFIKASKNFKIGNATLEDIFTKSAEDLEKLGLTLEEQFKIIQAIANIDWTGQESSIEEIKQKLAEAIAGVLDTEDVEVTADGVTITVKTEKPKVEIPEETKDIVAEEVKREAGKLTKDQIQLDIKDAEFEPQFGDEINDQTVIEYLDDLLLKVKKVKLVPEPNEGEEFIDLSAIRQIIEEALKDPIAPEGENENTEGGSSGWEIIANVIRSTINFINGWFNKGKKTIETEKDTIQKELQLSDQEMTGSVTGATLKESKDFKGITYSKDLQTFIDELKQQYNLSDSIDIIGLVSKILLMKQVPGEDGSGKTDIIPDDDLKKLAEEFGVPVEFVKALVHFLVLEKDPEKFDIVAGSIILELLNWANQNNISVPQVTAFLNEILLQSNDGNLTDSEIIKIAQAHGIIIEDKDAFIKMVRLFVGNCDNTTALGDIYTFLNRTGLPIEQAFAFVQEVVLESSKKNLTYDDIKGIANEYGIDLETAKALIALLNLEPKAGFKMEPSLALKLLIWAEKNNISIDKANAIIEYLTLQIKNNKNLSTEELAKDISEKYGIPIEQATGLIDQLTLGIKTDENGYNNIELMPEVLTYLSNNGIPVTTAKGIIKKLQLANEDGTITDAEIDAIAIVSGVNVNLVRGLVKILRLNTDADTVTNWGLNAINKLVAQGIDVNIATGLVSHLILKLSANPTIDDIKEVAESYGVSVETVIAAIKALSLVDPKTKIPISHVSEEIKNGTKVEEITLDQVEAIVTGIEAIVKDEEGNSRVITKEDLEKKLKELVETTGLSLGTVKAVVNQLDLIGPENLAEGSYASEIQTDGSMTIKINLAEGAKAELINGNTVTLTGDITGETDSLTIKPIGDFEAELGAYEITIVKNGEKYTATVPAKAVLANNAVEGTEQNTDGKWTIPGITFEFESSINLDQAKQDLIEFGRLYQQYMNALQASQEAKAKAASTYYTNLKTRKEAADKSLEADKALAEAEAALGAAMAKMKGDERQAGTQKVLVLEEGKTLGFRKEPNPNAETLGEGKYSGGTQVTVLEDLGNGWSKVMIGDEVGYMTSKYLQDFSEPRSQPTEEKIQAEIQEAASQQLEEDYKRLPPDKQQEVRDIAQDVLDSIGEYWKENILRQVKSKIDAGSSKEEIDEFLQNFFDEKKIKEDNQSSIREEVENYYNQKEAERKVAESDTKDDHALYEAVFGEKYTSETQEEFIRIALEKEQKAKELLEEAKKQNSEEEAKKFLIKSLEENDITNNIISSEVLKELHDYFEQIKAETTTEENKDQNDQKPSNQSSEQQNVQELTREEIIKLGDTLSTEIVNLLEEADTAEPSQLEDILLRASEILQKINDNPKLTEEETNAVPGLSDLIQELNEVYNSLKQSFEESANATANVKESSDNTTDATKELNDTLEKTAEASEQATQSAESATDAQQALAQATNNTEAATIATTTAQGNLTAAENQLSIQASITSSNLQATVDALQQVGSELEELARRAAAAAKSGGENGASSAKGTVSAKGNVALAKGTATLMGELGPELYVTNGHYYVAGQNGAEFVDLPDDAIVFNHIQTKRLLETGNAGRGVAISGENKAVSMATGNISGPAMSNAASVLATLKQIRAMWDSLLKASIKDIGSKAGAGKGSGGGGGGGKDDSGKTIKLDEGYIKDLTKWYNILRKIEKLEQDISYEEKLRQKLEADTVGRGKEIYESQKRSYEALEKEVEQRKNLAGLKKGYYEQWMEESKASPWGKFYYFDEEGTIQQSEEGAKFLANLYGYDKDTGAPLHSAREQYQMLIDKGFGSYMQYKDDGTKIEWTNDDGTVREEAYKEAIEAFTAKIDAMTEEGEQLREEFMQEQEALLDAQIKQNEILNAIRDNQIEVENQVYEALVDMRQREIDELQKQRDAIEKSSQKFIDGLNKQLSKERELYQDQQSNKELTQLQRQLQILQRSGGSTSQIRSLQDQIAQMEQENYFSEQEKQIEAIKEASDLQLERLDAQISLMTETLEYQKTHGLLWKDVDEIMQQDAPKIIDFITAKDSAWWNKSSEQAIKDYKELTEHVLEWTEFRDDLSQIGSDIKSAISTGLATIEIQAQRAAYTPMPASGDGGGTGGSSGGGSGGSSGGGSSKGGSGGRSSGGSNDYYSTWQYDTQYHWKRKDKSDMARHIFPGALTNGSVCSVCGFRTTPYTPGSSSPGGGVSSSHGYRFNFDGKVYTNRGYNTSSEAAREMEIRISQLKAQNPNGIATNKYYYKEGGLIDYTGPAWVDGTKQKPEGILSAEQLDMLRNSVLTKKNPIISLLNDYENIKYNTAKASDYAQIQQTQSITIEKAEVNMNVQKLANDYDARRAADTALEEMVRIARKSGANSVSRR